MSEEKNNKKENEKDEVVSNSNATDGAIEEEFEFTEQPIIEEGDINDEDLDENSRKKLKRRRADQPILTDKQIEEIIKRDGAYFESRYYYGLGRRKTSVARVQLFTKGNEKQFVVNGVDYKEYLKTSRLIRDVEKPLVVMKAMDKFSVKVQVSGGGITGQAGAIRLGIARALEEFNPDFRKRLRRKGFLTRDSRMVERKKFGKKKARRSPQWSKR